MTEVAGVVPYFWVLIAAVVGTLVVEIAVLRASGRRLRLLDGLGRRLQGAREGVAPPSIPGRAPELLAVLGPVTVTGILVASLQTSRHTILRVFTNPEDAHDVSLISQGLSGELNAVLFGILLLAVTTALAAVAAPLAVAARLRAQGLARAIALSTTAPEQAAVWAGSPGPHPGRLVGAVTAFVGLGLGPVVRAVYLSSVDRMKMFASLSGIDPDLKLVLLQQGLVEANEQLTQGLLVGRIGAVVAAGVAAGLLVGPVRARARALGSSEAPGRGLLALSALFLLLAAAAFAVARPLQRENETPWPPISQNSLGMPLEVQTPDLEGPDPFERAPVLAVTAKGLTLSGSVMDEERMQRSLGVLRSNYVILHPAEPFNARLLLACEPEIPGVRIVSVLSAALREGYERPLFTFVRHDTTERPLLGTRRRAVGTAAAFNLVTAADQAEAGSAILEGGKLATCQDLGARLVSLRRQGKNVALIVGR